MFTIRQLRTIPPQIRRVSIRRYKEIPKGTPKSLPGSLSVISKNKDMGTPSLVSGTGATISTFCFTLLMTAINPGLLPFASIGCVLGVPILYTNPVGANLRVILIPWVGLFVLVFIYNVFK